MDLNSTAQLIFPAKSVVVTSTNRLAHEQQLLTDLTRLERGEKAWKNDAILPFLGWVAKLWNDEKLGHAILDNAQLLKVSERVLDRLSSFPDPENTNNSLWDAKSATRLLLEAWNLCLEWNIKLSALQKFVDNDYALFTTWYSGLGETLKKNNWISVGQLPYLSNSGKFEELSRSSISFLGFDYFLPSQNHFIEQLQSNGSEINIVPPSYLYVNEPKYRHRFSNVQEEWSSIAIWAFEKTKHSSNIRIALICPDTQSIKDTAIQALEDQLQILNTVTPKLGLDHEKPYHLSLGTSLSETELGKSALMHLGLLAQFQFQDLSDWLISPLSDIKLGVEIRANIAIKLRKRVPYEMDLFTLVHALNPEKEDEAKIRAVFEALLALKKQTTGQRTYRKWATFFREVLLLLAWPKSGLNSHEHQVFESWNGCLGQFASLDVASEPVYLSEALSSIRRLCDQTIYQDQANPNVQIHIMGVLEAAELTFDAVWLAGFHENAWPPKPQVNPFIPLSIQKEKGIPDAVPEIFLQYAKEKIKQLLAMAPEVAVSHASNIDDISVGPSPLISHIELSEPTIKPFDIYSAIRDAHGELESIQDDMGVPFESDKAQGGAGLIASQASCPFQAYAKYRLLAEQEPNPEPGTDHRTHGTLVHEILHKFWAQVNTQHNLLALTDSHQLEQKLDSLISPAISKRNRTSGLKQQFDSAQASRIKTLLLNWLDLEATRAPFGVSHHEQLIEYSLAGLGLRFIIDRVDELEGRIGNAVIDYKTGGNNTEKDWCSDRPNSPQLPLYALAVAEQMGEVEAIAYGQINAKNTGLIGLTAETDLLPGLKPPDRHSKASNIYKDLEEWDNLFPLWKDRLEKLALAFRNGDAIVDPKDKNKTCVHCEFTSFCRIKELSADSIESDDK